jgi:hypothetical protein
VLQALFKIIVEVHTDVVTAPEKLLNHFINYSALLIKDAANRAAIQVDSQFYLFAQRKAVYQLFFNQKSGALTVVDDLFYRAHFKSMFFEGKPSG